MHSWLYRLLRPAPFLRGCACALGAAVLLLAAGGATAQPALERASEALVKAAFLHKFASFVEWPQGQFEKADSPLKIGILGNNAIWQDLSELAGYVYESGWFIGNDSGIGHLASNLGIPSVSVFRRRNVSEKWRPAWGNVEVVLPWQWVPSAFLKNRWWRETLTCARVLAAFERIVHRQTLAVHHTDQTPRHEPRVNVPQLEIETLR